MKKKISILGSTGSIGKSSLQILNLNKKKFSILLLSANSNYKEIIRQINLYRPLYFVVTDFFVYNKIKKNVTNKKTKILNKFNNVPTKLKFDITIAAIVGIAGLEPTIQFAKQSKKILLANKESIICGWHILSKIIKISKTKLIPIDSEHFSIKQLTNSYSDIDIKKIYITASGGPFLRRPISSFKKIKPADAYKHPNWNMGKKISVDSSNLMNKILELVEAHRLFSFNPKKYEIIVHPQSLVHAIVVFKNGQIKFLYHDTDMKIPISNAIYNNKVNIDKIIKKNNNFINQLKNIKFEKVDKKRFPIVTLNKDKFLSKSGPIILNASNEILVDSFLKKKIPYNGIYETLKRVFKDRDFNKYAVKKVPNINEIYKIDNWARKKTLEIISKNYAKNI
ncbi:MAG: hypothetical protein CBD56_00770 [Candidatus Pelagibacter sp. TMED196]|mgnify:CR=1 FL=1|nr:MAG: hypothetical protein CBD56_00770 [Candidatus Pelagibacter sp. TMED196]|tara:strand:+ start:1558 stop:2742 length:1185 start_codon:yes stop_codon:yes gene_type:complete